METQWPVGAMRSVALMGWHPCAPLANGTTAKILTEKTAKSSSHVDLRKWQFRNRSSLPRTKCMNESAVMTMVSAALMLAAGILAVIWAILWIFLPFVVYGMSKDLRAIREYLERRSAPRVQHRSAEERCPCPSCDTPTTVPSHRNCTCKKCGMEWSVPTTPPRV